MKEHRKYISIERLSEKNDDGIKSGDFVVIQEKLDGANASFIYNEFNGCLDCYSRNTCLDENNRLRGFFNFVNSINSEEYKKYKQYRFFGEWLVKHKVKYPEDKENKFYLFDIYDEDNERYLEWEKVLEVAKDVNLHTVPVFFEGVFASWEDCMKYVGQTKMGGEYGEGVVIKKRFSNNFDSRNIHYVKIVSEKFSEIAKNKVQDIGFLKEKEELENLVKSVVTRNRIEKMLMKFIDEGILTIDWCEKDLKTIAKILPSEIYKDCMKEEQDVMNEVGKSFGRISSKICMNFAKEILNNR